MSCKLQPNTDMCLMHFQLLTLRGSVLEDAIPNLKATNNNNTNNNSNKDNTKAMMNTKEVLEYVAPELQLAW